LPNSTFFGILVNKDSTEKAKPFARRGRKAAGEVKEVKKAIYATVVVTLFAFFASSLAQDLPRIFSGRIQTVDGASRTIAVMSSENEIIFRVAENTTIKTDHGGKVDFNELKSAMSVTVEYMKEGDDIHPLSIKVNTMPKGFGKIQKENQEEQQKKKEKGGKK
jgi:hypothetical protein